MKNTYSSKNRFATENDQKLEETFFQFLAGIPGQASTAKNNKSKDFKREREEKEMKGNQERQKLLVLTVGQTCSGKTTTAYNLSMAFKNAGISVAFGDKDTMYVPLSSKVCADRQSNRFYDLGIRDAEMDALENWALEAMLFSDTVIITAPYTREIAIAFKGGVSHRLAELRRKVNDRGGDLIVIYNSISIDTGVDRWLDRYNSDKAAFNRTQNMPHTREGLKEKLSENKIFYERSPENTAVNGRNCDTFYIFDGNNPVTAFEDLKVFLGLGGANWRFFPNIVNHFKLDDYEELD